MEGHVTVDEKPLTLHLNNARSQSRASSQSTSTHSSSADHIGFPGPFMQSGMFGYPPPMMSMWGYPPQGPSTMPQAGQHFGGPVPMLNNLNSTSAPNATATAVIIPDIIAWFSYLDQHEQRNNDGIVFAPYGVTLKNKGFLRLSQLTMDFVQLKDLQEWLGIDVGTAILIMQYAKEDLESLRSRKWVFPNLG